MTPFWSSKSDRVHVSERQHYREATCARRVAEKRCLPGTLAVFPKHLFNHWKAGPNRYQVVQCFVSRCVPPITNEWDVKDEDLVVSNADPYCSIQSDVEKSTTRKE